MAAAVSRPRFCPAPSKRRWKELAKNSKARTNHSSPEELRKSVKWGLRGTLGPVVNIQSMVGLWGSSGGAIPPNTPTPVLLPRLLVAS